MNDFYKKITWKQFGASIDMLENAIEACPEEHWGDLSDNHQFWYIAFHSLFWLDGYLNESVYDFKPPEPFGLSEFDPAGILPERVYTKKELLNYLQHGRSKCRSVISALDDESSRRIFTFGTLELPYLELILYNMRHLQHHTAQLNLMLRQNTDSAPRWVRATEKSLTLEND